jgi:hypothetical protein
VDFQFMHHFIRVYLVCFAFYNATVLAIRLFFSVTGTVLIPALHQEPVVEIWRHFAGGGGMEGFGRGQGRSEGGG